MKLFLEVAGTRIICKQNGFETASASVAEFLKLLVTSSDQQGLPEAIPEGVRFIKQRGDAVVLAIEEKPMARTVRWLQENSPVPYGKGAQYCNVRLAFPFTIIVVAFRGGSLTGYQQCFYRTAPLQKEQDSLLFPNLYNVARGYGLPCWLCLVNLPSLCRLSWEEKVRAIRKHLWWGGFNQSSEVHEGNSYWQTMRDIDTRVRSLAAWAKETEKDPFFSLTVQWRTAGKSVGEVMEELLAKVAPPRLPASVSVDDLIPLLNRCSRKPGLLKKLWAHKPKVVT